MQVWGLRLSPHSCQSHARLLFDDLFCYFMSLGVIVLWKCQQESMTPHWVTVKRRKESTCHYPWYRKCSYFRAWSLSVCETTYWRICCENYHYVWHIKKKDNLLKIYSDTGDIKLMKIGKTFHKKNEVLKHVSIQWSDNSSHLVWIFIHFATVIVMCLITKWCRRLHWGYYTMYIYKPYYRFKIRKNAGFWNTSGPKNFG
jgi:hypothetical protein